ncbi:hypothetical protein VNI00_018307 [Paramarasmius palmivorus]|uniref:BZIP domain-containing protein n=1 Tax=Paramarasmius palmivorus TaxID=297713 RepID=A0AAW0B106_9AGAR
MPPLFLMTQGPLETSPSSLSPQPLDFKKPSPSNSSLLFNEDLRRSPSPTPSIASSTDSDQSLISALWDKIYKGRVLVRYPDGWRYEWCDDSPNPSSDPNGPSHAISELQEDKIVQEPSMADRPRRLDPIDTRCFYGPPPVSSSHPTVEVGNVSPCVTGETTSPNSSQRGTTRDGSPLIVTSADRRRLQNNERKARSRAQNREAARAKQAIYAARYRAKNREILRVKAQNYRRKRKGLAQRGFSPELASLT